MKEMISEIMEGIKLPDYQVIRSRRRTLSVEITADAKVVVRAPLRMSSLEIRGFLETKALWISEHLEKRKRQMLESGAREKEPPLSEEEIHNLAVQAGKVLAQRTEYYAEKIGVTYGRITIRCQKTRWGSCSSKGNLNYNCLLMLTPPEVQDYVVVHELCHRKEMNHSRRFWAEVAKILPDYQKPRKWLTENGMRIMARSR